jgi:hypothetical protein
VRRFNKLLLLMAAQQKKFQEMQKKNTDSLTKG